MKVLLMKLANCTIGDRQFFTGNDFTRCTLEFRDSGAWPAFMPKLAQDLRHVIWIGTRLTVLPKPESTLHIFVLVLCNYLY